MLHIPTDTEVLDKYTEEDLIEEAINTNSTKIEIGVEKFISYDEKHCEYYTETIHTYSVDLMEYVDVDDIIEYCYLKYKDEK